MGVIATIHPPPPPTHTHTHKMGLFEDGTKINWAGAYRECAADQTVFEQVHVKQRFNIEHPLKPQDSFGEFEKKKNLDLQKVQEIIRKHHQTFLQLF